MNILIIMLNKKNKSKRRRSLKRRNVKSRKMMRGGGFDVADVTNHVLKKGKANLYKIFPVDFGPDGLPKISTHDIEYQIIEILKEGTVAHIRVIKIDHDNINGYFIHINYPKGTIETYKPNTDMRNSYILKMTNGDKYGFLEIL
jgi:hypothetical protein